MRAGLLRRLLSVAASGLAVGTLLAAALGGAGAPAGASGPTVTGGGSSWIYLAMEQWEADVVSPNFGNLSINYEESSSVTGLNQFAQSQITFAASEIGYSTGQANYTPPSSDTYQYLPAVGGADCLMYNLTGVPALHVDSSVVTGIMTGTITSWMGVHRLKSSRARVVWVRSETTMIRRQCSLATRAATYSASPRVSRGSARKQMIRTPWTGWGQGTAFFPPSEMTATGA